MKLTVFFLFMWIQLISYLQNLSMIHFLFRHVICLVDSEQYLKVQPSKNPTAQQWLQVFIYICYVVLSSSLVQFAVLNVPFQGEVCIWKWRVYSVVFGVFSWCVVFLLQLVWCGVQRCAVCSVSQVVCSMQCVVCSI